MPKLIVNPSSPTRRDIPLTHSVLSIGRDPTNDLVLPDAMVSRRHAVIECRSGQYFLRDCNSSNGSLVNGDRVSERSLRDGDLMAIGAARLLFREEAAAIDASGKVVQHPSAPRLSCPACDADYRRGDVFCRQCGQRVQEGTSKAVCTTCGTVVVLPARFCNACGTTLGDMKSTTTHPVSPEGPQEPAASEGGREPSEGPPRPRAAAAAVAVARDVPVRKGVARPDAAQRRLPSPPRPEPSAEPGQRLLAMLIDAAVVLVGQAVLLVPAWLYWRSAPLDGSAAAPGFVPVLVSMLLALAAVLLGAGYHVYFWGVRGTTPGKHFLGLRVEGLDGEFPIGVRRALLRLVGYLLSIAALGIGFLSIAFGGVGLHDRLAGTRVVSRGRD